MKASSDDGAREVIRGRSFDTAALKITNAADPLPDPTRAPGGRFDAAGHALRETSASNVPTFAVLVETVMMRIDCIPGARRKKARSAHVRRICRA